MGNLFSDHQKERGCIIKNVTEIIEIKGKLYAVEIKVSSKDGCEPLPVSSWVNTGEKPIWDENEVAPSKNLLPVVL